MENFVNGQYFFIYWYMFTSLQLSILMQKRVWKWVDRCKVLKGLYSLRLKIHLSLLEILLLLK